jgi:serine/threonine protein phosphatase PrpC
VTVTSAVATHPGLRREGNEDAFCVRADLGLYLVADGMGGHAAGEVASRLAVKTIEEFIHDTRQADLSSTWPFAVDTVLSIDGNRLKSAFLLANRQIASAMADDDALRGMATTASAVLFGPEGATVGHMGDSRVYRLRAGELTGLTEDHSWVNDQVRAGLMTETDARRHPWRNVVTRAITGGEEPEPDVTAVSFSPKDRVLVCSDGLSSVVAHEQLAGLVAGPGTLDEVCARLIQAANDAGGPDNITVIVIDVA